MKRLIICPHCGALVENCYSICGNCGEKLNEEAEDIPC